MFDYDVIIIGGGPAGLTAGLYAARARLQTVLLEKMVLGGQIATTEMLENYPGFPEPIAGASLGPLFEAQAKKFGLEILQFHEGLEIAPLSPGFEVRVSPARELRGKAVIVATGTQWRSLGIPGESELKGAGVSYCATCDGAFFRDQEVAVIGGGNSAVEEAIFLTKFAKRVYVIHRRDALRAEKIVQERAFANPKIEFVWNHVPVRINGDGAVTGIEIENVKSGERRQLPVDGVFIYVGMEGNTGFLRGLVALDERGFVQAGEDTVTSCPGLFAAGDVRQKLLRQVVTATADGAVAAVQAGKYIEGNFS
ncbi:MAG: thioredoxin-disulfide reductase [Deltaproteobacteria bacterium]|nr:thioredoxin-disulfide reductase [Deltaproteobacteria bacterium]